MADWAGTRVPGLGGHRRGSHKFGEGQSKVFWSVPIMCGSDRQGPEVKEEISKVLISECGHTGPADGGSQLPCGHRYYAI